MSIKDDLDQMNITQLKNFSKLYKIPGYSRFRKDDVVEFREHIRNVLASPQQPIAEKSIFDTSFEELNVSTKTIVVKTNIDIFTENVFDTLPVVTIDVPPSIRSKKKLKPFVMEHDFADGTIIALEYEKNCRGINIRHFRNQMSVIMIIDSKMIHFKVPLRGQIQLTGCNKDEHAEQCIKEFWNLLREYHTEEKPLYQFQNEETEFMAIFRVKMTNRHFRLGFTVDREALDLYINRNHSRGRSLVEDTFGYAGVNIKFDYTHKNIKLKTWIHNQLTGWRWKYVMYDDYLNSLSPKEYQTEISKKRKITFMVFRSGAIIISGPDAEHMRDEFYRFIELIKQCRPLIETS